jgi:hypothetical protein
MEERRLSMHNMVQRKRSILISNIGIILKKEQMRHLNDLVVFKEKDNRFRELDMMENLNIIRDCTQRNFHAVTKFGEQVSAAEQQKATINLRADALRNHIYQKEAEIRNVDRKLDTLNEYKAFVEEVRALSQHNDHDTRYSVQPSTKNTSDAEKFDNRKTVFLTTNYKRYESIFKAVGSGTEADSFWDVLRKVEGDNFRLFDKILTAETNMNDATERLEAKIIQAKDEEVNFGRKKAELESEERELVAEWKKKQKMACAEIQDDPVTWLSTVNQETENCGSIVMAAEEPTNGNRVHISIPLLQEYVSRFLREYGFRCDSIFPVKIFASLEAVFLFLETQRRVLETGWPSLFASLRKKFNQKYRKAEDEEAAVKKTRHRKREERLEAVQRRIAASKLSRKLLPRKYLIRKAGSTEPLLHSRNQSIEDYYYF